MTAAPITDFGGYGHDELVRMLGAGDPASVRAAADLWRQVTRSLQERSDGVQAQLERFAPHWKGGAAQQYVAMVTEFTEGVTDVSELLASTRDLMYSAAEALQRAQAELPAAVAVPELSPTALTLGTWPAPDAVATWERLADDQRAQVTDEMRRNQEVTGQAAVARSRAVAIMSELAVHYLGVSDSMPALPVAGDPPPVPEDTVAANAVATTLATEERTGAPAVTATGPADAAPAGRHAAAAAPAPLFADMYRAGSLAASAAVLGRFRLGAGWLAQRRAAKKKDAATGAAKAGPKHAAVEPDHGSSPQGFGRVIGGGGGADVPTANPVLAGGGAAAGVAGPASSFVPSGSAGGTSGGTGMGGMPYLPPPMAGGGDGGAGVGSRRPPWLVETEPLFDGESVPVTPSVIGEQPDPPAGSRSWTDRQASTSRWT